MEHKDPRLTPEDGVFVRWLGHVPAGRTSKAIMSTLDVLPTLLTLVGAADGVPKDRVIDGVDQSDLLAGASERGARTDFRYSDGAKLQAVRKGDWKLRLAGLKQLRNWPELDRGTQNS